MGKLKAHFHNELVARSLETEPDEALVWLIKLTEYPCPVCGEVTVFKLGHSDCLNAELEFGGTGEC